MKLTKKEFDKLQKYWYKRLEEGGFKDIETSKEINNYDYFIQGYRNLNDISKYTKAHYYSLLTQHVNSGDTIFRNLIDKHILTRFSEGAKINTIVKELKDRGMSRDRYSVRVIIRRYEMIWNIKSYTRKQLHLKDKKKK